MSATDWRRAPTWRVAQMADVEGDRLFVQQTTRSVRAHALIGEEFEAFVNGICAGRFRTIEAGRDGALKARLQTGRHARAAA